MPFIVYFSVYFFVLLLTLYIPLPTALLFFHRLANQHDLLTTIHKFILLFLVCLDYRFSFYCIYQCKIKKQYYLYLILINIIELGIHFYLLVKYQTVCLTIITLSQLLLLICMFTFPLSKKFRKAVFHSPEKSNVA